MCDPATIAASIAVAASIATTVQQQGAASQENAYQKIVYGQRKDAALETFAALREREFQERAKAAQDIRQVTQQAQHATAQAKLNALEGGVGGASYQALLQTFERGQLANVGIVQSNLSAVSRQIHEEAVGAGRIQGPANTQGPLSSPLGILSSGLSATSAGMDAYHTYAPPKST